MTDADGLFGILYSAGITTELFPLLIFIGVGAMIDFSPLLAQPKMALLGAAGQFGIFGTLILAIALGFSIWTCPVIFGLFWALTLAILAVLHGSWELRPPKVG
jgi:Na+-transporting methylmalonyl-CoA/oxaloacetate decarboxylase beta subunit